MLKALELVGFKSFADKTRFEFPPGITVVVGPNGSGKSNIVDGIKWVLGEQSAKSLRGKDMADVIFKGNNSGESGRKALNSAEATIVLDNEQRLFDLDADEVHVTRRVYRSGEGEYLINGEPCRLKDIRDLFRGTGVATDAYSLIEQGKVDQMLQASTKDRRAIFEEAAGISRFKAKKLETQRRLARVEQNLVRLSDIVEEVDRRYRSIKAQASKATRYQELSQRLKVLRTGLGWADWHRFATRLEEIETTRLELNQKLSDDLAQLQSLEAARVELEMQEAELGKRSAAIESKLSDHRERIAASDNSAGHLRVRDSELAEEEHRIRQQRVSNRMRDQELARRVRLAQEKAEAAELEYRDAAEAVGELESKLASLDSQLSTAQERLHSQADEQRRLAKEVSLLSREIGVESSRLEESRKTGHKLEEQVTAWELDRQQQQDELSQLQQEQLRLEHEADQKDSALADARRELEATRQRLTSHQEQLTEFKTERSGAGRRAEIIEELEQKLEGVHAGVRQLIEQSRVRRSEQPTDVVGLVADLIQVDVKHAPLIDVALGDVAQHIVLDGQHLMEQLLDGTLQLAGRVGLIRLSELKTSSRSESSELSDQPGVIGPADEMVDCQSEYRSLVSHVLGDTWLVKNLADALRLREEGHDRYRYVTLTGQLVEPDGTLIVGPRTTAGGLVSRRSELRSLKAHLQRLDRQIEEEQLQVVELQEAVGKQEQSLQTMIDEHSEVASLLADHRLMAGNLQERLQNTQRQLRDGHEELRELHARIEQADEKLLKQQTDATRKETQLEQIETELEQLNKQVTEEEAERTELVDSLTSRKVALAKAEQFLETVQEQLQQDEGEHQARLQELASLAERLQQCVNRRAETRHQLLSTTADLATLHLEKQELGREGQVLSLDARRLRDQRVAAAGELETLRSNQHEIEQKLHQFDLESGRLQMERDSILSRLRDDYGIEVDSLSEPEDWDEGREREEIEEEIQTLKRKINTMGAVNLEALNELSELESRFGALNAQYNDLVSAKESLTRIIERINADSRRLFAETLEAIRTNFQALYRRSFGGGKADLVLEPGVDILEAGIDIIATPPGKPEFNNSLLSGGEKALTAVALLLAIFQYRPSPFCVLDEVDAPFDEANIGRFIDVLTGFLDRTRFVIVTHSKKTMTAATTLYGVTMQESGVSKRVSVQFEDVSEEGHISNRALERDSEDDQDAA